MLSNTGKGKLFQETCRKALERMYGCPFELEISLPIPPRKSRRFDLANSDQRIVAECKAVGWTETGNVPAAKITHLREAVQYLRDLPGERTRCLIILKSCHSRQKESLGSYFVRLNRDYLRDVNIFELSEHGDDLVRLHPRDVGPVHEDPLPVITVSELGNLRRSLFGILDLAEGRRNRDEGPAKRVSRLRNEGKIPRNVANLIHTILGFRDAAEYDDHVLTPDEVATINHAWKVITKWAHEKGWQTNESLPSRA